MAQAFGLPEPPLPGRDELNGQELERWIVESRNSAIGTAQPIPHQIRAALAAYVDEDLLNRVRLKVGDNGSLNLGRLSTSFGDAVAITLIDLVVFRSWDQFGSDPIQWTG